MHEISSVFACVASAIFSQSCTLAHGVIHFFNINNSSNEITYSNLSNKTSPRGQQSRASGNDRQNVKNVRKC